MFQLCSFSPRFKKQRGHDAKLLQHLCPLSLCSLLYKPLALAKSPQCLSSLKCYSSTCQSSHRQNTRLQVAGKERVARTWNTCHNRLFRGESRSLMRPSLWDNCDRFCCDPYKSWKHWTASHEQRSTSTCESFPLRQRGKDRETLSLWLDWEPRTNTRHPPNHSSMYGMFYFCGLNRSSRAKACCQW